MRKPDCLKHNYREGAVPTRAREAGRVSNFTARLEICARLFDERGWTAPANDCREAAAEIDRLLAALAIYGEHGESCWTTRDGLLAATAAGVQGIDQTKCTCGLAEYLERAAAGGLIPG
jgi:hypothetical protein